MVFLRSESSTYAVLPLSLCLPKHVHVLIFTFNADSRADLASCHRSFSQLHDNSIAAHVIEGSLVSDKHYGIAECLDPSTLLDTIVVRSGTAKVHGSNRFSTAVTSAPVRSCTVTCLQHIRTRFILTLIDVIQVMH